MAQNQIFASQIQNATITTTQISATAGILNSQMAAWNQNQSAGSFQLNNLANGVATTDAVNLGQLNAVVQGLYPKAACAAASQTNITVTYATTGGLNSAGQITAAPNVVDGVTLAVGSRVLLTGQTTATQNGIWQVATVGTGSTGVWNRPTDFCNGTVVNTGDWTIVDGGTANAGISFYLTTTGTIVIDTGSATALAFAILSAATAYTAGNGISIASHVVSASLAAGGGLGFNSGAITISLGTNPCLTTTSGLALQLATNPGLSATGSGLTVLLNGATLALGASGLSVANAGITSTQIATSTLGGGLTGGAGTVITPWYSAEVPSGTINGSNTAFTLAHTFYSQTGSATDATALQVYVNGLLQNPTTDYTVSGSNTITLGFAPPTGSTIFATYFRAT